ncbi:MAG TPA: hypothetical protein VEB86_17110, partial [Chryseosolibacter sp.]|nr:hypothetical protein [Chryseosolibacter sp.]
YCGSYDPCADGNWGNDGQKAHRRTVQHESLTSPVWWPRFRWDGFALLDFKRREIVSRDGKSLARSIQVTFKNYDYGFNGFLQKG